MVGGDGYLVVEWGEWVIVIVEVFVDDEVFMYVFNNVGFVYFDLGDERGEVIF